MAEASLHAAELPAARPWYRRRLWVWPLLLFGLLIVYYLGGMLWLHEIDDDPEFALESSAPEGASQAVAVAADLIEREIETHRWVANDPFFMPGSVLDNMPAYQQGIVTAISRFALELADQIARHDLAGRDADARRERHRKAQAADRIDEVEPRPDRALGIVLVGLWVAEIGQHAVAQKLGDVALEPGDHCGDARLVRVHHLAQILRIEAGGELGRSDQVAK
jgi:hypothetical protein